MVEKVENVDSLLSNEHTHACAVCGLLFDDDGFDTCESCDDSVELPEEDFSLAPHTCGGNDPYFCKKCDPN